MGKVGIGLGKANEVSEAIRKAGEAPGGMITVPLVRGTIRTKRRPLWRRPRAEAGFAGTGVIAGGPSAPF